jgi:hypothetical protein
MWWTGTRGSSRLRSIRSRTKAGTDSTIGSARKSIHSEEYGVSLLGVTIAVIAAWSAIFTGSPMAWNGVSGNEWFVREEI